MPSPSSSSSSSSPSLFPGQNPLQRGNKISAKFSSHLATISPFAFQPPNSSPLTKITVSRSSSSTSLAPENAIVFAAFLAHVNIYTPITFKTRTQSPTSVAAFAPTAASMAKLHVLALLFCIVLDAISAVDFHPDAIALLRVKSAVKSDPSNLLADWDPSAKPHCSWRGVACEGASGRVVSLNLVASGLSGGLSPAVGNLSALRTLSLARNLFFGEIPAEIGRLGLLETLELQANNHGKLAKGGNHCRPTT